MNRSARRCIQWGVGCVLIGTVALVYLPSLFIRFSDFVGPTTNAGLDVLNILSTALRWLLFPLGASLIAGGVVLNEILAALGKSGFREHPDSREGEEI